MTIHTDTDTSFMADDPFALDPAIAELCDGPVPAPIDWALAERLTGCSRDTYFAVLSNMLVMAGVRMLAGYRQSARRARGVRHRAIAAGVMRPPTRESAEQRHLRAIGRLGYGPYAEAVA